MAIFSTKDFSAGKSDKVRKAFGRKLGLAGPASNKQVDDALTQYCREVVEIDETADYYAAKPAPDQL